MNLTILFTILVLSGIGSASAIILYFTSRKFKVEENPLIDDTEAALPLANCGGCGFAGCRNFAEACVKSKDLSELYCPVGGNETMAAIAKLLGRETIDKDPRVAVLRCNGSCYVRPQTSKYNGAGCCAISAFLYGGETDCQFGCLGFGDCVEVCKFDALYMDAHTGLPVVDDEKCTACGACVKSCPKKLFELRKRALKNRKIYVACRNEDKGGIARKNCNAACTGCTKCFKICPHEAITMNNNLAFIDSDKCKLCRKCVPECPTEAIIEIGFPPRKESVEAVDTNPSVIEKSSE